MVKCKKNEQLLVCICPVLVTSCDTASITVIGVMLSPVTTGTGYSGPFLAWELHRIFLCAFMTSVI